MKVGMARVGLSSFTGKALDARFTKSLSAQITTLFPGLRSFVMINE